MIAIPDVLRLTEADPARPAVEAMLARLEEPLLRALWSRTREAARRARGTGDMATVFDLVRGTKTIQRIADARGIVIHAR